MSEAAAPIDVDKWVHQYIVIRDYLRREKEKYEAHVAQAKKDQEILAGRLQQFLDTTGQIRGACRTGTFYTSTKTSATIKDKSQFTRFVIGGGLWDLVDWRANAPAVKDFTKEHKDLPPGVALTTISRIGVRRPGASENEDE